MNIMNIMNTENIMKIMKIMNIILIIVQIDCQAMFCPTRAFFLETPLVVTCWTVSYINVHFAKTK